jgi:ASC-1-like (ASCH) protein
MVHKYVPKESFNCIIAKKQTHLAKLNAGFWKDIDIGQSVYLTDGERTVEVIVDKIAYFNNFGDAWFTLGEKLVPSQIKDIITEGDAIRYFREFYTDVDVGACGVVAIQIIAITSDVS